MATSAATAHSDLRNGQASEPILEAGDRLSREEFEKRIEGAPELVVEIVGSSQAYDLHQKKGAYRRNGVQEYLAWIVREQRLVWWELKQGEYQEMNSDVNGLLKSGVFPGLWLDTKALLGGDMKAVLATLRRGLQRPEHQAFLGT